MKEDKNHKILQSGENQSLNSNYIKPKQSANALFNFMQRLDYLKMILKNKAIIPRYFEEDINYLGIEIGKISIPVTCFCDINLQRISSHTSEYGEYGIGLYKEWCVVQGIQPIHYINERSKLVEDFRLAFNSALGYDSENSEVNNLQNYLFSHLFFIKPILGDMKRSIKDEKVHLNFHDEREWRYIPKLAEINTELLPVLIFDQNNDKTRNLYNRALYDLSDAWMEISPDNIKYLIVKDKFDQVDLINYLSTEELNYTQKEKLYLISKIVILEEISEDW
ncbi:abortive infection system antitoxin AbiGi family protein [Desulfuribacillus alkaliarsenatis]|uniref:Uncharacterized protein n=1 Tax=Desulfuribacillus alkaliarsenatis TaxID=766136 RepID=A0A1E5G3A5_9FIRM|nr:abortive infection system antitoxin AbiGi family protein [Desulfuribacillus alkaliarsenatis]OEF97555.1 hypothetical protein BHF68_04940 [Desulfuribacillus alkaliarsenatis]